MIQLLLIIKIYTYKLTRKQFMQYRIKLIVLVMVKQNKTIAGGARMSALEAELTGNAVSAMLSDNKTGLRTVQEPFQKRLDKKNNIFLAKKGFRRRHPHSVLGRYHGLISTTDNASTVVEAAMEHEHVRSQIPKEYRPSNESMGLSTMYHIQATANTNFKQSKKKLENMHLVGV